MLPHLDGWSDGRRPPPKHYRTAGIEAIAASWSRPRARARVAPLRRPAANADALIDASTSAASGAKLLPHAAAPPAGDGESGAKGVDVAGNRRACGEQLRVPMNPLLEQAEAARSPTRPPGAGRDQAEQGRSSKECSACERPRTPSGAVKAGPARRVERRCKALEHAHDARPVGAVRAAALRRLRHSRRSARQSIRRGSAFGISGTRCRPSARHIRRTVRARLRQSPCRRA